MCSEKFMKEHFKHCSFKKQTHPPDWGETAQQMNFKDKLEVTAKPTQITNTQTTLRCNWGGATELEGYKNEVKFYKSLQPLQSS